MSTILEEVNKRASAIVSKNANMSLFDAQSEVFRQDPSLYEAYRREVTTGAPLTKRAVVGGSAIEEVRARVSRLVSKGMAEADATAKIFRDDGELYRQYVQESTVGAHPPVSVARRQEAADIFTRGAQAIRKADETLDDAMSRYSGTVEGRYWYDLHAGRDPLPPPQPAVSKTERVPVAKADSLYKAARAIDAALSTGRDTGALDYVVKKLRATAKDLPGPLARQLVEQCDEFLSSPA